MPGPTIDQAFITKFNRDLHLTYQQQKSKLRGTVRTDGEVNGSTVRFQKLGSISMVSKARNGEIPVSNPAHTYADATMADKYLRVLIDKLDLTKLNIDVRNGYINSMAAAAARETDDILITAMDSTTVETNSYSGNLTRNKVLTAINLLDAANVPDDGMRFAAISPAAWAHMMCIDQFVRSDYIGPELPFTKTGVEVRTWLGVHWMKHTRLSGVGTATCKSYLYHSSSVGHGIASDVDMQWVWNNGVFAWDGAGALSMGAVVIDTSGIVEVQIDDTAALP